MPTLYRTTCNTDWKGRPTHELLVLGTGTREELVAIQNQDVARWQANDIACDRQAELGDAEAEEREPNPVSDVWAVEDVRWEMESTQAGLREFAGGGEGEWWSIVYHILD